MKLTDILSLDNEIIPYRKELNAITGGVMASILLSQMLYWVKKSGNGFYKFKTPSKNKFYKNGDSWCEELGFSVKELDGALKRLKDKGFIDWQTDYTRVTSWIVNLEILEEKISKIQNTKTTNNDLPKSQNSTYINDKTAFTKTTKGNLYNLQNGIYLNDKKGFTKITKWYLPKYQKGIYVNDKRAFTYKNNNYSSRDYTEITQRLPETTSENLLSAREKKSVPDFPKSSDLKNKKNEEDLVSKPKISNVEAYEQSLKSFDLKYKTDFNTPGLAYKKRLKEFIDKQRIKNPSYQSYEEFEISLLAKGYKYQNFAMAYLTWQSNNQKNGSSYKNNFQNGYQNGFKEETSPEMREYLDRYLKRLDEPSPFNYYDTIMADYRAQQRSLNA
ncbi:hypothetical protein [Campylobacter ureolyticus]|uniref:hypothetical protein n=1 Tax=Campylobacter ureolyticus TaxID=827 RepID=UPI0022B4F036|nr:hypothetical protein [Campylobacter ureolyticus]MCZ6116906.1 hypothetical protein [Campylobacter ureolyticus]